MSGTDAAFVASEEKKEEKQYSMNAAAFEAKGKEEKKAKGKKAKGKEAKIRIPSVSKKAKETVLDERIVGKWKVQLVGLN